jgi:hypothetical protein
VHAKTRPPNYAPCVSAVTFTRLQAGSYVFYVRAVGPGGRDRTPATYAFAIP